MARHASTYRQARRAAWREESPASSWADFNTRHKADGYRIGRVNARPPMDWPYGARPKPSKYMPHIGAKQRAKGASA